jgi:hypothetical protein
LLVGLEVDAQAMMLGGALLFAPVGALAGVVHFVLLRHNVRFLLGAGPPLAAVLLPLGRLALTSLVLAAAAHAGWPALLSCAGGIIVARRFVLRQVEASGP